MATTNVARLHGPRDVRLHVEPVPTPAHDETLLDVTAVGLCGSDRHWFEDGGIGGTMLDRPLTLGHEIAAVIADGPRRGQRVVVEPAIPCDRCVTCVAGRPELCPTAGFAGFGPTDGGLRGQMPWPTHLLQSVPDTIDDDDASVLEALGVALHAVALADVTPDARVAVIGCGPIGLLVIRALRADGVRSIVAADPLPHRLAAAIDAGAAVISEPMTAPGTEVDVAIECAGEDAAVDRAIELTRPGGRVILVGIPGSDQTTFTASVARRKGLTLILCRRMRSVDLARAVDLVATGKIDVTPVISHRFPLGAVDQAFAVLADRSGLKVVVRPGATQMTAR